MWHILFFVMRAGHEDVCFSRSLSLGLMERRCALFISPAKGVVKKARVVSEYAMPFVGPTTKPLTQSWAFS